MKFPRKLAASAGALLLIGSVAVTASATVTPKTYFACLKAGTLSHVSLKKSKCPAKSTQISWNSVGQTGAAGAQGDVGPTGAPGPAGSNGSNGYSHGYFVRGVATIPANTNANMDSDDHSGIMHEGIGNGVIVNLPTLRAGKYVGTFTVNYRFPSDSTSPQVSIYCAVVTPDYGSNYVYIRSSDPILSGDSGTGTLGFGLNADAVPRLFCYNQVELGASYPVDYSMELVKVNTLDVSDLNGVG